MAKATSLADSLWKHLECAVCLEQYTEPKVLPCLHSFCKRCLQGLLIQEGAVFKINCPTCRLSAKIPLGKIDLLPVNFFVNNLLSMVALHEDSDTGKLGCNNCDSKDPPVSRCATCSLFLCDFCNEAHRRGLSTRSHNLMSLEEAKKMGSAAVTKPSFCKEHEGELMKLFCETCEKAICRDCTIVKHRDHKYTFVKDAFSKGKESLMKILSKTKTKVSVLEGAVDSVLKMKSNVHSCTEQTVQEVIDCFEELTACLDARRGQLIDKVEEFKKAKLKSLEIQQDELQTALASVRSSVEFTEKAFESGSEVEILNMRKQMASRLQDLNSAKWQLEPYVNEEVKYKSDNNQLKHGIATFGAVTDVVTHAAMSTVTMENGQEGVMYNTLCGQAVKFNIIAKERNGRKRKEGGDIFEVFIGGEQQIKVVDCENGTYSFSLKPFETGQYKLSVQMKGNHVQGSPFQWCVEKWNLVSFALDSESLLNLSEENMTAEYIELLPGKVNDWLLDEELEYEPAVAGYSFDPRQNWHVQHPAYLQEPYAQTVPVEQVPYVSLPFTRKEEISGSSGVSNSDRKQTAVGSVGFKNGKHMWKVHIHGKPLQGFSFGIINTNRNKKGKLVKCGSKWVWNAKKKQYPLSGTQKASPSNITDCSSGDIIELYLDLQDKKLMMYNPRTQQSDTWGGVSGEVSPVFLVATNGDKISLKIPKKV